MTALPDLRIRNRLGTGGPSAVFTAYDARLARQVAVVRLSRSLGEDRERLRSWAQVRHPAVVQIYDVIDRGEELFVVLEYVGGRTLASLIAEGPFELALALHVGSQVAEGLGAIHARGLAHGELRTGNVNVTPAGSAKILWGGGHATGLTTSPEQVHGMPADSRSDLFALGAVLYEMVTGLSPFEDLDPVAARDKILTYRQPPTEQIDVRIPAELSDLIDSLLEKQPEDRPTEAAAVAGSLVEIAGLSRSWSGESLRFWTGAERPHAVETARREPPRSHAATSFNPKYHFEDFVVGVSSQFAHAAARAVAENPSRSYNPLFLYGGVGLGKTHLLHAIGSHVQKHRPELKVAYLAAEQFVNELIHAIRFDRMTEFRKRYRTTDVLLIDDIQFLAGKERTQEEFFHTFNDLYSSEKQIVLSSDSSPRDIPTLEERLRSRFEWGLIADIQPPDLETKMAILRRKADLEGVQLSDDLAHFIASQVWANVRELEGLLNRVLAFSSLTGRPMSLDLARETLKDILPALQGEEPPRRKRLAKRRQVAAREAPPGNPIDELYTELRRLMVSKAAGEKGLEEQIEKRLEQLRRLQQEEAAVMRERFESGLGLAAGAGWEALRNAGKLLGGDETPAAANPATDE